MTAASSLAQRHVVVPVSGCRRYNRTLCSSQRRKFTACSVVIKLNLLLGTVKVGTKCYDLVYSNPSPREPLHEIAKGFAEARYEQR